MSFERPFNNVFFRTAVCFTSLLLAAGPSSADARDRQSVCDRANVLGLDTTLRVSGSLPNESLFFRVEALEPGFLSLDVTARGGAGAQPVLVPVNAGCGGLSSSRPIVLERTMASLLLVIESPSDYLFQVAASDPTEPLSEIKVRTGHSPFGEDEEEIESEPNPFAGDSKLPQNGGEDEEEIESEPNPFAGHGSKVDFLGAVMTEICTLGERDDHGDTFGCATAVTPGIAVEGEIDNDWGDDVDVFRFDLAGSEATDLWRVDVSTSGAIATAGVLFDRHGEPLGRARAGVGGDDFRLARVLRPGVYFVRVGGRRGAEGAYRLTLDVSLP